LYKTEEDVVFTEGSTSLAVISSIAGKPEERQGLSTGSPKTEAKNAISYLFLSFLFLPLPLCYNSCLISHPFADQNPTESS